MNIVSMVLQYLAPALIGKLASGSGVSQSITEKLVKAAVPVILGALVGKSAKADGARALFDMLAKQDTGLLGRLSSVLGSPQQKTIAEQGSTALGSLLGGSPLGSLVGAIAKYSGADPQQAGGLIGMLAPIVLGTLSQQQKSTNLDAGGIAKLLSDQKSNISAMIPSDLSKLLAGTGILDAVLPKPASPAPSSSGYGTSSAAPARPADAASFNGWPWAILVGAASLLWGALFSGPPSPWASVPAPPRLMAGSTDVAGEFDSALKGLHGLMATVRDRNTAEAALPQFPCGAVDVRPTRWCCQAAPHQRQAGIGRLHRHVAAGGHAADGGIGRQHDSRAGGQAVPRRRQNQVGRPRQGLIAPTRSFASGNTGFLGACGVAGHLENACAFPPRSDLCHTPC